MRIDDIFVIGVYHTMLLDDEVDFFVFVDKKGNKEFICINYDLSTNSFYELAKYFKLDVNLKPADEKEAALFLLKLSGRRHSVITSVAVKSPAGTRVRDVVTAVKMKRLSDEELNGYLATGDWDGKAGAYAIQGPAGAFIPWIQGSYTGVMGLPVAETATLLKSVGIDVSGGRS